MSLISIKHKRHGRIGLLLVLFVVVGGDGGRGDGDNLGMSVLFERVSVARNFDWATVRSFD